MTKAIVLGGSKGIGKAIAQALQSIDIDTVATSRRDIDTSDIASVKNFLETHRQTDNSSLEYRRPSANTVPRYHRGGLEQVPQSVIFGILHHTAEHQDKRWKATSF